METWRPTADEDECVYDHDAGKTEIGVHVDGGGTVHWGLVYLNGEPPSKKKVENALREAGFDFVHNVVTQAAFVWTGHTNGEKNG